MEKKHNVKPLSWTYIFNFVSLTYFRIMYAISLERLQNLKKKHYIIYFINNWLLFLSDICYYWTVLKIFNAKK